MTKGSQKWIEKEKTNVKSHRVLFQGLRYKN
jgi:hypothetical protein